MVASIYARQSPQGSRLYDKILNNRHRNRRMLVTAYSSLGLKSRPAIKQSVPSYKHDIHVYMLLYYFFLVASLLTRLAPRFFDAEESLLPFRKEAGLHVLLISFFDESESSPTPPLEFVA